MLAVSAMGMATSCSHARTAPLVRKPTTESPHPGFAETAHPGLSESSRGDEKPTFPKSEIIPVFPRTQRPRWDRTSRTSSFAMIVLWPDTRSVRTTSGSRSCRGIRLEDPEGIPARPSPEVEQSEYHGTPLSSSRLDSSGVVGSHAQLVCS